MSTPTLDGTDAASRRQPPIGLIAGVVLGFIILTVWNNMKLAWAVYLSLGVILMAIAPIVARLAGGIDRLFFTMFVIGLQLNLSFNVHYDNTPMPGGYQGITITFIFMWAAAIVGLWLLRRGGENPERWRFDPRFLRAALLFFAAAALSLFTSSSKTTSLYGLFGLAVQITVAMVASHFAARRDTLRSMTNLLLFALLAQSLVFLFQKSTGAVFTLSGEVMDSRWGERYGGTMGIAPANLATLLMVTLLIAENRVLVGTRPRSVVVPGILGLGILCLLLSLTRSAWIAFGLGSVYLMYQAFRCGRLRIGTVSMVGGLAAVMLVVAWGPVRDRLDANHSRAADERWKLNEIAYEMIKAHPVTGIGVNTAYISKRQYLSKNFTDEDWIYIPHNQYLIVAGETGMVGFFAFVGVLLVGLRCAWRARASPDPFVHQTADALVAAIVGMMWGMTLDFYGGMPVYTLLWFILGMASGMYSMVEREARGARETRAAAVAAVPARATA